MNLKKLLAAALLCAACEPAASVGEPELVSSLGHAYFANEDTTGTVARADSALAEQPGDIEALLDAAAARASLWRYRDAIALYDTAIALHPGDWRPWRFRGHRHISLRRFDQAVRDLEEAARLDSLSFDVAYHLGLAYYQQGDFDRSAAAYARCMDLARDSSAVPLRATLPAGYRSCMDMAEVDNDLVAISEWRWRALRRAGRIEEAARLLEPLHADMNVGTNASYHQLLLLHKGELPLEQVFDTTNLTGNQFETVGYGVAVQWLTEGDTARALDLMERIVARGDRWQAFGFISAETDLLRLGETR